MLLAPFVYIRRFAGAAWPKRLLFPLGLIVGVTAYAMSKYSIGGWVERSAVLFFNTLFLFSLFRAWHLRREPVLTLRWMTRAIGVLLGIATTRPIMGIFFATGRLTDLSPRQFFGGAFWLFLARYPRRRAFASITRRRGSNRKDGKASIAALAFSGARNRGGHGALQKVGKIHRFFAVSRTRQVRGVIYSL